MGGGTSKFEENVWEQADGKLEDPSHTVDGVPPTMEYEVFELQKRAVNQREFNIVDAEKNLMYTTRSVSGTLTWFDVLGPGSCGEHEDLRLRIQADLARRTWIVFRYNKPLFAGQKVAHTVVSSATKKSHQLFKTACITVSWSRYVAVAARYGPPPISSSFFMGATPDDGIDGQVESFDEDDMIMQAAKIAARRRTESEADTDIMDESASGTSNQQNPSDNASITDEGNAGKSMNESMSEIKRSTSPAAKMISTAAALASSCELCTMPTQSSPPSADYDPESTKLSLELANVEGKMTARDKVQENPPADSETPPEPSSSRVRDYFMTTSSSIGQLLNFQKGDETAAGTNKLNRQQSLNPEYETQLEGVIDLDEMPIVKCQEIYNKFIGNHQTSRIGKQEMVEMLQLDQEQHEKEEQKHPDTKLDESIATTESNPLVVAVEHEQEMDDNFVSTLDGRRMKSAWSRVTSSFRGDEKAIETDADPADENAVKVVGEAAVSKKDEGPVFDKTAVDVADGEKDTIVAEATLVEQPLVGYWSWKNSILVHKMELHLAKNSDLALHVALAIIANQVRYERNAIAMTV